MPHEETVTGRSPNVDGTPHRYQFDEALDDALQKASKGLDPGEHEVELRFTAKVKVTNPGAILDYFVEITPKR